MSEEIKVTVIEDNEDEDKKVIQVERTTVGADNTTVGEAKINLENLIMKRESVIDEHERTLAYWDGEIARHKEILEKAGVSEK